MRKALVALFALPIFVVWVFPSHATPHEYSQSEGSPRPAAPHTVWHKPTDAVIRYESLAGGDDFLIICRDWAAAGGGCAEDSVRGVLYHGEDSLTKYGWADTDGYYHPREGCTTGSRLGSWIEISHETQRTGWVKVFGSQGASWTVTMRCGSPHTGPTP